MTGKLINSLADVHVGGRAKVQRLEGGKDFISRMAVLGFTEGAEVQVIQNYGHGPVIVSIRETRVALGRGQASRVLVEVED